MTNEYDRLSQVEVGEAKQLAEQAYINAMNKALTENFLIRKIANGWIISQGPPNQIMPYGQRTAEHFAEDIDAIAAFLKKVQQEQEDASQA
jgi:hypothetical protein